jgi:arylsulfatase
MFGSNPGTCDAGLRAVLETELITKRIASLLMSLVFLLTGAFGSQSVQAADERPNFLLIVADDLGWTDVGCFGSEIKTPNIDALAEAGVEFTDFHVSVSCSPTRSMLMTGTDNHIAGLGPMSELLTDELREKPGYEGHLNDRVVTLAEVLRDGGYHTYMAGKWHLGEEPEHYPAARGFEESFSMLYGGASYWGDMTGVMAVTQEVAKYVRNDQVLQRLPGDFYATRDYTDIMPTMLEMAQLESPETFRGREVAPMRGRSIAGLLSGEKEDVYSSNESVGAEMGGGKWLRQGNY